MKILTHTLSAMEVGRSLQIKQLHADETTKRKKSVLGVVTTILQENNKLKTICLAGDIIPENGTAEVQTKKIILSFAEGGRLLDAWREETTSMYADDPDCFLFVRYLWSHTKGPKIICQDSHCYVPQEGNHR